MSNRDKKLLSVLVVLLILVLVYYLGYKPLDNKQKEIQQEIYSIDSELIKLRVDYDKKEEYESKIVEMMEEVELIQADFPAELNQERAFRLLFDIEDAFDEIEFSAVTFSDMNMIVSNDSTNSEEHLSLISQDMFTSLDLEYEQLKAFLNFINNYPDKSVTSSVGMSYNEEENQINMSFTLTMYALIGGNRDIDEVEFDSVEIGNPVPFRAANVEIEELEEEIVYPTDGGEDLFISLKPEDSDGFAYIVGLANNPSKSTYVEYESAAPAAGIIRVYEENGTYYWNYDVGGTYKERQQFSVGSVIEVEVYSSKRIASDDNVTMNLSVINQTDVALLLSVTEDDPLIPRLNVISTEGDVTIK